MKFGVLQFFSWPERRIPLAQVYERAMQRIQIMDRTGYDAVWLAEHHFNSFSVCPSVHLMGAHVAARTQRLRIGTAVTLAAFYHPLRIAEEVALLDVLSGGRVNWGAGRGFDATEFQAFEVPGEESAERFREAVEVDDTNDQAHYYLALLSFHQFQDYANAERHLRKALDLIAISNKHFYKALDETTIMIIPDNPQKRRDLDRKSTRLNSSHMSESRMPSSA